MAQFLTTRGIAYELENIIKNAKRDLVLISPYIKIPQGLWQRFKDAERVNNVKTILVYGKRGLEPDVQNQLQELHNLSVLFLENLHAKCFYNEQCMLITSMNLHHFSEQHNREMGVLIRAREDPEVFLSAVAEAESIIQSARPQVLAKKTEISSQPTPTSVGHCIRCGGNIPLNPEKPFCRDCYKIWEKYWDPEYEEKYCLLCGKLARTSFVRPLCRPCYESIRVR